MNDVLIGGLLTLAGTALGAASTWFVKRVELKSQRQQAQVERLATYQRDQEQRVDEFNERRRLAYVSFLAAATHATDVTKEISRLSGKATQDLEGRNTAAWGAFLRSWAEVSIFGPHTVVEAANQLHDSLSKMFANTDEYLASNQWSAEVGNSYARTEQQRAVARDAFISQAAATVAFSSGVAPS